MNPQHSNTSSDSSDGSSISTSSVGSANSLENRMEIGQGDGKFIRSNSNNNSSSSDSGFSNFGEKTAAQEPKPKTPPTKLPNVAITIPTKRPTKVQQKLQIKVTEFQFPKVQCFLSFYSFKIDFEFHIGKDNTNYMAEELSKNLIQSADTKDNDFYDTENFKEDLSKLLAHTICELYVIEVHKLLERQRMQRDALEQQFSEELLQILKSSQEIDSLTKRQYEVCKQQQRAKMISAIGNSQQYHQQQPRVSFQQPLPQPQHSPRLHQQMWNHNPQSTPPTPKTNQIKHFHHRPAKLCFSTTPNHVAAVSNQHTLDTPMSPRLFNLPSSPCFTGDIHPLSVQSPGDPITRIQQQQQPQQQQQQLPPQQRPIVHHSHDFYYRNYEQQQPNIGSVSRSQYLQ
jgi:hypothetical protein